MTITQQVKNLLAYSKDARNSDKELYILYLQRAGMEMTKEQIQLIREMPSFETIRRVRQKVQEAGEYLADEPVRKARDNKSMEMQQNMPKASASRTEQILSNGTKLHVPAGFKVLERG
jgi:hypothetical protein